jgi:hypothetical protein
MIEEEDSIQQPYILIEGPRWGDAQFCAEWLLSAAKANEFWRKALNDPNFRHLSGTQRNGRCHS